MKQVVEFCATPRGRVAYSVTGSGPPIVWLAGWVSDLESLWDVPGHRRFVEALSRQHTVIRYDRVGCGLSDRSRDDFSPESELAVLDALVDHLGLRRFVLFGSCDGGHVAATYAARSPENVASLLLYGTCARGRDLATDAMQRSLLSLIDAHWGLGSRVLADIWFPDAPAETLRHFAHFQRSAATAEMTAALLDFFYRGDVHDLLPAIQVPTLVLQRRNGRAVRFELGVELASLIPGAQLVALEGRMAPIYWEHEDVAAAAVLLFLGGHGVVANGGRDPRQLTARELQVAALIAEGLTNGKIAAVLGVAARTVDAHVEHIRNKLGLRSRAQIAVWATERRQAQSTLAG